MIQWRVMKIILIIIYLMFTFVHLEINNNNDNNNELSNKFKRNKPAYSSIGSNALARSALVERQEKLQYNCEDIIAAKKINERVLIPNDFRNILVNDELELLYCYVPKVACTNWKRVLMIATGKWSGNNPLEIPGNLTHAAGTFKRLSNFTMLEIERKLSNYDTLIVVRHPLERLLSAYRNKFEAKDEIGSKYFQNRFGRKIIKNYRRNPTKESLTKGDDVTFSEFVDFITNKNINGTSNEHWKPIYELCLPCDVNYNLISKYETLAEDAMEILERIGAGSLTFPMRASSNEPTAGKLEHYYSMLTYKQIKKLAKMYKMDLKLFEYSLEQVLGFSLA
ncbi:carbohydrate sulfotransferase 11 [Microplitis demolitor]|uniref:carbohydrate sulfotransferase 11 n=1 Tax=Microplitis demolitor TaxID=69319 RepID=UPI0004CCEBE8|nr:carbohydrate sulfotransferase 11 [Microplitis demolitor]XP_008550442.1 carbohydrate sulfotransferase 11 [Microplitis demolitor]